MLKAIVDAMLVIILYCQLTGILLKSELNFEKFPFYGVQKPFKRSGTEKLNE